MDSIRSFNSVSSRMSFACLVDEFGHLNSQGTSTCMDTFKFMPDFR